MTSKPINKVSREAVDAFSQMAHLPNDFGHYQALAVMSAIYPGKGTPFGLMYAALGLAEAGEVQNKVKKLFRDDGVIDFEEFPEHGITTVDFKPVSPERRRQIMKELGGVLWYVAAVCEELQTSMAEVAVANLQELADRAARGTLQGSGDNR